MLEQIKKQRSILLIPIVDQIAGMVAPVFVFLAGLSVSIAARRAAQRGAQEFLDAVQGGVAILIDSEQIFKDGRCRKRNIPPSEKMLPGETFVDAAQRCLVEELHIKPQNITIYPETHKMRQERRDSYSYPGLPSLYTIHSVEVAVRGIPQQDFRTFELNNPGEGVVREHRWAWQSPPPELA